MNNTYQRWCEDEYFDADTRAELKAIADDPQEIKERFYKDLEFGTGGLRGILGAGTNRMNIYTVRKATQGLANFIIKENAQAKGVAIALTPDICHRNLQKRQLSAWQQTESRLTFSHPCVRLQCFLSHFVS